MPPQPSDRSFILGRPDAPFGGDFPRNGDTGRPGFLNPGVLPTWSFDFSDDLTAVIGASVSFGDTAKTLDIDDVTFTTVTGVNDLGEIGVVTVTEQTSDGFGTHVSLFSDTDGNGQFARDLDLRVASDDDHLRTHSYTFDDSGEVTGETATASFGPMHHGGPDDQVSYETVELDGTTYVVQTETRGDHVDYEIARDDNGDGIWTVVATAHAQGELGGSSFAFNLNDIDIYLASASSVIG